MELSEKGISSRDCPGKHTIHTEAELESRQVETVRALARVKEWVLSTRDSGMEVCRLPFMRDDQMQKAAGYQSTLQFAEGYMQTS